MTKFINLKTSPNRVEFTGDFLIEDEGLYEFFKQYGAGEYDHWFERALRLGAYALEEERIAAFRSCRKRDRCGPRATQSHLQDGPS